MSETILELERVLLATLMQRPADCYGVTLQPADLSTDAHEAILAAILDATADSRPVDPVSIADDLERAGKRPAATLALRIVAEAAVTTSPGAYADRIGAAARSRRAAAIARDLVASVAADGDKAIDAAVEALMGLHNGQARHEWTLKSATKAAYEHLVEMDKLGGKLPGISTGMPSLDHFLGGFQPGDLVILGARPAMGKSALLLCWALNAASAGHPVGVISGEQPAMQVAQRAMAVNSGVAATRFRTGDLEDHHWAQVTSAVATNAGLPIHILDRSSPSITEVVRVARRWSMQHGIKALFVDYLQRLEGPGERKFEQVAHIVRALKNLARDLNIPVIVAAQVSRAVEARKTPKPHMGDLSDSSEIEKEADQVLMLYRAEYYERDNAGARGLAEIIIEKNRHGGTGLITCAFDSPTMKFSERVA